MKISKLIEVLQEHLQQAGDIPVVLHHDRLYLLEAINSVSIGCTEHDLHRACIICTPLGNSVIEAHAAATEARSEIAKIKATSGA